MRLLVRLSKPSMYHRGKWRPDYATFECLALRLHGPMVSGKGFGAFIHADVDLPPQYARYASEQRRNPDGTYRVEVIVNHNAKTLAPFLASGLIEMDVRETT
ncbi:hypothetical protein P9239_00270 [Caballeronia sp. LZ062]|uniref:hypothetical protein n=1 Tax=unclassified Caballeronia TaxID=2646786 RepID=UPI002864E795|nr:MULTISPECIES: hypothetical protein [unclassified Caballeronia]MDR5856623.1 hypothetical protein [Caballeronia sp. LZ050]MDR5868791.1 hypothetical protein [Caballeronia sp. LZ062]